MVSDAQLVEDSLRGNETATEQLFRRYHLRIYNYLLRMLANREEAEDAAQEAFINALRGLKGYREQGQFKSWLFRIAHREGLRALKKCGKSCKAEPRKEEERDLVAEIPDPSPHAAKRLAAKQQTEFLEAAISELPQTEREVLLLRMKDDLSFKEIALVMNCPLNTALGRMRNATKKLRRALADKGIFDEES